MMITITILAKNCASTLRKTLASTKAFPEVLILDTGSTDATLEIAKEFSNTRICSSPFLGFGKTHNLATSLAKYDWILSLDSDEVLTEELVQEIRSLSLNDKTVYRIQRHNYFNGKHIKWCGGWYPDPVNRLYNRKETQFNDALVHEKILTDGLAIQGLIHPMLHTPYLEMQDFLNKMQVYTTLFAEQHQGKKKSSFLKALLHSWTAFIKSYIFKKGFLGGKEGFIISLYNAHTALYKYLKLAEKNSQL